jgi:hypothetical protein
MFQSRRRSVVMPDQHHGTATLHGDAIWQSALTGNAFSDRIPRAFAGRQNPDALMLK